MISLNNYDKWLAAIALREAFEFIYDNNDFTYDFTQRYPNLVGNRTARNEEYEKYSGHIEHISKKQDQEYLADIYNSVFVLKSDEIKTPYGDFKIRTRKFIENLKGDFLVDNSDCLKSGGKTYSLLIKGRYVYKSPEPGSTVFSDYEREGVVISSDLNFIAANLIKSIDIENKRIRAHKIQAACPEEIQVLEGSNVLLTVPVRHPLFKTMPDGKHVTPIFDELKVVNATHRDLKAFEVLLTPAQARRARGQTLSHDLGL